MPSTPPESTPDASKSMSEPESGSGSSENTVPQNQSLIRRAVVNGSIFGFVNFAEQPVRFLINVILTRMVPPEVFGIIALIRTLVSGAQMFSDVGIGPSIIQNRAGDDPKLLNTAWTVQCVRGVVIWLICCLGAIPMGYFYGWDMLMYVPIATMTAIIGGLLPTKVQTAKRHLQLKELAIINLLVLITNSVFTLSLVWLILNWYDIPVGVHLDETQEYNPNIVQTIWGIIIAGILSIFARLFFSELIIKGIVNKLYWSWEHARELLKFGKWIFFTTALTFIARDFDKLVLGSYSGTKELGLYWLAVSITQIPAMLIHTMGSSVVFPSIARKQDMPRPLLRKKIAKLRIYILAPMAFGTAFIMMGTDWMIRLIYEGAYENIAWMVAAMSVMTWILTIRQTLDPALMSLGKPAYSFASMVTQVIYVLAAIFAVLQLPEEYVLFAFVFAMGLKELPGHFVMQVGLKREGLLLYKQDLLWTGVFILCVIALGALRLSLGFELPLPPAILEQLPEILRPQLD